MNFFSAMKHRLSAIGHGWLHLTTRHPVWTLLGCAVFLAVGLSGIRDFKLDASTDALLLENDPALRQYRETIRSYGFGDFLIVTWESERGLFHEQSIRSIQSLVTDIKKVEGVESALSLLDAVILPEEPVPLGEIIDSLRQVSDEDVDLALAQQQLSASRVFRDLLLDREGKLTAIQVNLSPSDNGYTELVDERYQVRDALALASSPQLTGRIEEINRQIGLLNEQALTRQQRLVGQMRQVLDKHRAQDAAATIYLGGPAMIIVDMVDAIREDMVVFGVAALLLFLLMLGVFFRRIAWVMLPLISSMAVVLFMSGLLGWANWKVTVISSNFAALLMILAISLSVHLMVRHRELCGRMQGRSAADIAHETARQMFIPCLYAALTTLVAFGSLVLSGIKPVIEFGKMMGLGMTVALVLSFTLLPAFLSLVGPPATRSDKDWTQKVTQALAWIAEYRGTAVLATAGALFALTGYGITRLEVDNRFIDYFKEDTEIYQGMLRIDERLGGTVPFDVVLRAPEQPAPPPAAAADSADEEFEDFPELEDIFELEEEQAEEPTAASGFWFNSFGLNRLREVHRALEAEPGVGKVLSLSSMLDIAEQMKGGKPLSNLELAVMREYVPDDLAQSLFDPYLSQDGNEARLTARVVESTPGLRRNELITRLHQMMHDKGFTEQEYKIVGVAVLYNNMLQSLYSSQVQTLGLVFLIIGLVFILLFRSVKLALLAMAPNLLAAGMVLGSLGLLGIPLDLVTVTVAAISVGIAVDNSIHYIYRYRLEQAKSGDYEKAISASHSTVGQGIYYTSFSIMAGFLVFVLSNFIPTNYFGLFTALAMLMALLGSLTLLPRLLVLFKPFAPRATATKT